MYCATLKESSPLGLKFQERCAYRPTSRIWNQFFKTLLGSWDIKEIVKFTRPHLNLKCHPIWTLGCRFEPRYVIGFMIYNEPRDVILNLDMSSGSNFTWTRSVILHLDMHLGSNPMVNPRRHFASGYASGFISSYEPKVSFCNWICIRVQILWWTQGITLNPDSHSLKSKYWDIENLAVFQFTNLLLESL